MKNSDIAAIILIASLSMLAAYFIADGIIGKPGNESVKVKTVEKITSEVVEPSTAVFNKDAINPTIPVIIGEGADINTTEASTNTPRQDQR